MNIRPLAAFASSTTFFEKKQKKHQDELTRFQLINGIPGVTVIVSKKRKHVLKYASGYSNVETLQPMKLNTVCRIGSISKLFAAVGIDRLNIDCTENLEKYLPWLSESPSKNCTVLDILRHESGIRHYKQKESNDEETKCNINFKTAKQAIQHLKLDTDQLLTEKIGKFSYSTHAFTFLQAIIEEQTKISYSKYLEKELFSQIGMYNTFPDKTTEITPNRSQNYHRKTNKLENCSEIDQSWKLAGGGMVSNAEDLVKFGNWLLENYHKKSDKMLETHRVGGKSVNDMSEVVWLTGFDPRLGGGHAGASFGGSCMLYVNVEKELVVVVLTNQSDSHVGMMRLVKMLADDY